MAPILPHTAFRLLPSESGTVSGLSFWLLVNVAAFPSTGQGLVGRKKESQETDH